MEKEKNEPGVIFAPYVPCDVDTESETYKMVEKIRKMSDEELFDVYSDIMKEIYCRTHKHCPDCGSESVSSTCVGYVPNVSGSTLKEWVESFKYDDRNRSRCVECGWVGKTDELE